jgi:pimeloyl-ACP methyl ester carboxylesterase
VPLVLFQHFRGNLDSWDPALIDALASTRRVITFDNTGVAGSTGSTPNTVEQMAHDAIAFIAAMDFGQADLLGFSIGSFVAQQVALTRPGHRAKAGPCVRSAAGRRRHARLGP